MAKRHREQHVSGVTGSGGTMLHGGIRVQGGTQVGGQGGVQVGSQDVARLDI